jgi:nicotinamide-nucleotide amidase
VGSLPPVSLERELRDLLGDRSDIRVATAESCTGGNIARRIVSVDGSSAYFVGGIVAYANDVKQHVLGVPAGILENPGAVSEETAIAMVEGARTVLSADYAVSSTGIAGPTGGTARKPVGLVYIGQAGPRGTIVERHVFAGDRGDVIDAATQRALELLVNALRHAT